MRSCEATFADTEARLARDLDRIPVPRRDPASPGSLAGGPG